MKDETIKEFEQQIAQCEFIGASDENYSEMLLKPEHLKDALQANQSLTEQNQKLVNEAVKMREAFEELLESSYKYAHEDSNREDWRRKAGLTINEKGEG